MDREGVLFPCQVEDKLPSHVRPEAVWKHVHKSLLRVAKQKNHCSLPGVSCASDGDVLHSFPAHLPKRAGKQAPSWNLSPPAPSPPLPPYGLATAPSKSSIERFDRLPWKLPRRARPLQQSPSVRQCCQATGHMAFPSNNTTAGTCQSS